MKQTGILMPVSALPSRTGVGDLGAAAFQWIDIMRDAGVKIWQILPLNPVGYGNSPYQPYSSYAGDELYISLELLKEEGLLDEEIPEFDKDAKRVDYVGVRAFKEPFLRKAYETFITGNTKEKDVATYMEFVSQQWVYTYGLFQALKKVNDGACWNDWKQEEKDWPEQLLNGKKPTPLSTEIEAEVQYQIFLQYIFYKQWMSVKKKANESGIQIMGDMPFYVGQDSVDVWAGKENFLLDTDGRPLFIAGVPPDYFCATGQRWGNPIYDWDYMKAHGYQFWVDRVGYSSKLYDILRIDHFRAFDTFWKIPASCPTAVEGAWIEAPGYEVIDTLLEKLPGVNLVAEDLGDMRPEVFVLKDHYHLKGMHVLQFTLDTAGKCAFDRAEDIENVILYTGTHDNDTLMEWYGNLTQAAQRKVRRFLKRQNCGNGSVKERLLAYVLSRKAEYVIIPAQDILGIGKEGHMNRPGTVGSPNWEWHLDRFDEIEKEMKKYRRMIAR